MAALAEDRLADEDHALAARLYDAAYDTKPYEAEARWVAEQALARNPGARTLLDVACGTGRHLEHLAARFACQGIDLEAAYAAMAAARTGVPVHVGDFHAFDLGERFDVVTCLFSAIAYAHDLPVAVARLAAHLRPGGVLLVEPWSTPQAWTSGGPFLVRTKDERFDTVRMARTDREDRTSILDFHFLVGSAERIVHRHELHRLALFTDDQTRAAFEAAGLEVEHRTDGPSDRGCWLGVRP
jgi:SAM-dependent methyltransferase